MAEAGGQYAATEFGKWLAGLGTAAGTAEVIVISNGSSVIYYVAVISPGVVIAVGNSITVNAFTYTISQIA